MQESRLKYLLDKYKTNSCNAEELQELEEWYNTLNAGEQTIDGTKGMILTEKKLHELKQRIKEQEPTKAPVVPIKKYRWLQISTAAAIIGFLCISIYLFISHSNKTTTEKTQAIFAKKDIIPGGNKAILTLADGSSIVLDSAQNGKLTQQGAIKVLKIDSGSLRYEASSNENIVAFNTLSTPRGGQYQIVLSDGTKVWLNAASSLKYPTAFKGNERNVELTGEAYFEVAKNVSMPFIVSVNNMKVEVLGTHFNINGYNDEEATKTTLLEGSVKIINQSKNALLIPGQQAITKLNDNNIDVANVDAAEAIAWRYGRTSFKDENVKEIMRQVSRWYDVDVMYQGNISDRKFTGGISRASDISDVLNALKLNGYEFKLSGKTIEVKETP